MTIFPLSEGAFTVDQTKKFVPFQLDKDDLQQRSKGSILVEIQPFAIITSRDILLCDTGLGFADENNYMQIHKNLAKHGIKPADVTKVLLSHLHKDHAGGIAKTNKKELVFENALYYINKAEWDFAFEKQSSSYTTSDFELLKNSRQLRFTTGKGFIDDYIEFETTGGHSPFHQAFLIEDEGDKIFFGGDVAPQLQQMKNRFRAKYDFDGNKAMELRREWWETGEKENWTFLFYHDIKVPYFKF